MKNTLNCMLFVSLLLLLCSSSVKTENTDDINQNFLKGKSIHQHIESRNVQFHSLKKNELLATTDLDDKDDFKHYYFIQSDKKIDLNKLENSFYEIEFNDSYLIFKGKRNNIIFSIDDNNIGSFKSNKDIYFSVFGISKRHTGKNSLNLKSPSLRFGRLECHSGGEGSSECSTESGAPLSGNCSVKCRNTHYACCDDTRNECKCIQNGKKPNEITAPE